MGYGKEITIKMVNKKYKDSYAIENLIKYTVTDKKRKKEAQHPSQGTERLRRYHPN